MTHHQQKNRMRVCRLSRPFTALLCVAMACLCGCVSANRIHAEKKIALPIAVVPFDSLAANPNAGLALSGMVEDALQRRGVDVIPREKTLAALAGSEGETLAPDQLGGKLEVPTLLIGQVIEYRYKSGVGEQPVIALSVRLVDAKSGAVLWSARVSESGRYTWFGGDSLGRLGQSVTDRIARSVETAVTKSNASAKPLKTAATEQ